MATTYPAPPTIVINVPGAGTSTVSALRTLPPNSTTTINTKGTTKPAAPRITTQPPPPTQTSPDDQSCYLCDEQNPGDFSPTTKYLDTCLLCSRHFCPIHKSEQWDNVCNINHSHHYHSCLERAKDELSLKSPGGRDEVLEDKMEEIEDQLVRDGIYPSLGEREKSIWKTSPVSDAKIREIENFRKLDAELSGTRGKRASSLVEVKDIVGADIAV